MQTNQPPLVVEARHVDAVNEHARNKMKYGETIYTAFARFEQSIRTTDAARIAELEAAMCRISGMEWADENHAASKAVVMRSIARATLSKDQSHG